MKRRPVSSFWFQYTLFANITLTVFSASQALKAGVVDVQWAILAVVCGLLFVAQIVDLGLST